MPNLYQLTQLIEQKAPPRHSRYLKELGKILLERAPLEFLQALDSRDLYGLIQGAADFLEVRAPGEILLRLYNPSPEEHGWSSKFTALEVALEDCPFILDSLREELNRNNVAVHYVIHPIILVRRESTGKLQRESLGKRSGVRESYELFLLEAQEPARLGPLEARLRSVLEDVVLATRDHEAMRRRAQQIAEELSREEPQLQQMSMLSGAPNVQEFVDFLDWLLDDNFVFLGYREYVIKQETGVPCLQMEGERALGILRKLESSSYQSPVPIADLPPDLRKRVTTGPVLLVTKSNAESTVHRPARMDYIGIKRLSRKGEIEREQRFLGLFTAKAHSTAVDQIPIIRRKLKQVLALDEAIEDSHDFNQIVGIFNSMPREELFWATPEQLHRDIRAVMGVEGDRGVRVTLRPDPLQRGLAVMVIMPRKRFNSQVRLKIQDYLMERLEAVHVDYHLAMRQDQSQIRFHFFYTTDTPADQVDLAEINQQVARLTRSWDDAFLEALHREFETAEAARLAEKYSKIFAEVYKADIPPEQAVADIRPLEEVSRNQILVNVQNPEPASDENCATHLKIYHPRPNLVLSEVFPVLENLGLRVIEQISYPLSPEEGDEETATFQRGIDVFRVQDQHGRPLNIEEQRESLLDALTKLLHGEAENDRLNQLVVSARMPISRVALLKTYRSYLAQLQPATSRSFITDTLLAFPTIAATLYGLFHARFAPGIDHREARQKEIRNEFLDQLNQVSSLPSDQTLRALLGLVEATVRTNFFLNRGHISLKVDSRQVREMPEPRPMCEIMVSSPHVEGIHLRGGKVARGGIRWSDRPDDFRTEVLGLMKTQMTKNAVIVPVGSKGGFVVKHPPSSRQELSAYVQQQYRTFVRGLLDLTDNLRDGEVIPPQGVVCHDQPDPYLVVAADKGTATFSDLANEISSEYDFWLGDAFASGGSFGYDHKKEGITARGAWECVARHFRELGIDVKEQEFKAVGIGDMSGDVFGNGMLYTDKLRLLAAFNHLHIFIDPQPDATTGHAERKRLFQLPRSSWQDYDTSLISSGGGIFSRQAKSISLTPQIRECLGIEEETLSGEGLIRAILRAQVDLLWNGGIGTYVKAGSERNSEVGDSANNNVRIDANEVRARVVGEGGNLGFTQLARIEYCLAGGRMNTDAIDNSGGVDMSDHEVNLKILFQPLMQGKKLTFEERNDLLRKMTDEVSELVLRDNYTQSLCLSLAEETSRERLDLYRSLQEHLAECHSLRPGVEYLPTGKLFAERARLNKGLTRPELAVLLAYTKMRFTQQLLSTRLPEEESLQSYLRNYFPRAVQERFSEYLADHPLRREIIACQLTNLLADRLGMTFLHEVSRETAGDSGDVLWASLATIDVLGLRDLWGEVFKLDNRVPSEVQYAALGEIQKTVRQCVEWILGSKVQRDDFGSFVAEYRQPLAEISRNLTEYLSSKDRNRLQRKVGRLSREGLEEDLAQRIGGLEYMPSIMGIIEAIRASGRPSSEVARIYYTLGDRLALGRLRDHIIDMEPTGTWEKIAASGLIQDLRNLQKNLTIQFLETQDKGPLSVSDFLAAFPKGLERYSLAYTEIRRSHHFSLAAASVLTRILLDIEAEVRRRKG